MNKLEKAMKLQREGLAGPAVENFVKAVQQGIPGAVVLYVEALVSLGMIRPLLEDPAVPDDSVAPWEQLVEEGHEAGRHEHYTTVVRAVAELAPPGFALKLGGLVSEDDCCAGTAELLYRRALDQGDRRALNDLACLLMDDERRLEEAEILLRRAVSEGDQLAHANLARVLARRGEHVRSIESFTTALAGGNSGVLPELGTEYLLVGETGKAETVLRRAVSEGVEDAHSALAAFLASRGEELAAEAERHYRKAIDLQEFEAEWNYAVFLSAQHRYAEAVPLYEAALRSGSTGAELNLAVARERLGDREAAERHYRAALALGDLLAYYDYAAFLLEADRLTDAQKLLAAATTEGADQPAREIQGLITDYRGFKASG